MSKTFSVYWGQIVPDRQWAPKFGEPYRLFNERKLLAKAITTTDNNFIFILTDVQIHTFRDWLEQYKLKSHVVFESPKLVNRNYHEKRLWMFVLKGKNENENHARV